MAWKEPLYALFNGDYTRATTDIDLLAQCISNDIEEMKKVDTSLAKRERIAKKVSV